MTGKNAPSRILVLLGSPHRNGTTAVLARRFTEGAEESGCAVKMIQCSDLDVRPCMACHGYGCEGPCRIRDDMDIVRDEALGSDVIVYVTPIYYAGVSAQLKAVMDRFYGFNREFKSRGFGMALITAAHERTMASTAPAVSQYREIVSYTGSRDLGMVNALGCGVPGDLEGTVYPSMAYDLGRSVR